MPSGRHNLYWIAAAVAVSAIVGGLALRRANQTPGTATGTSAVSRPTEADSSRNRPGDIETTPPSVDGPPAAATASSPTSQAAKAIPSARAEGWRALTKFDFAALPIDQMPPDDGNVSPIAPDDQAPLEGSAKALKKVTDALPAWAPGHVTDRVQRVRNYLLLLGVADFAQSPIERFLPGSVLAHMLTEFSRDDLAQLTCWVALHPDEGDISALKDPVLVELGAATLDAGEVRTRTYYYGVKLTRRIIGW